jgi:hypothetical protein
MSAGHSSRKPTVRRDGWTVERQLSFLDALARTRSITKAVRTAGMSRESAYRLRDRAQLFAALWDRALAFEPEPAKVDIDALGSGAMMRLLGIHFRRERGDFRAIGVKRPESRGP